MAKTGNFIEACRGVLRDALTTTWELYKIMVPVIIGVRVLIELDVIHWLAWPLKPVMALVGLPPVMGLAWATAMVNNIYAGIIVMLQLLPGAPLTAAQATVLAVLMLVAHGLPVELRIAQKTGARLPFQALSRVAGALLLGWILHTVYTATDTLQGPAAILMDPGAARQNPALSAWAWAQAKNLASIFLIILGLIGLMRLLNAMGVITLLNRLLRPLLNLLGVGERASTVTVIGLTLGISYGGGLIIREAREGRLPHKEAFFSLTLMGLCHSLVEDTLLLIMAGGHISGVLWGRLFFSLIAVGLLVRLARLLPRRITSRFFWVEPAKGEAATAEKV